MPTELKMPALSPTMEEGTLAKWLVKEGDTVKSGDLLAEIETDKATMEFEAVDEGVISKILVPEGSEGVKVGAAIALLTGEGESPLPSGTSGEDSPRLSSDRPGDDRPDVGDSPKASGVRATAPSEEVTSPSPSAADAAPPSPGGRGEEAPIAAALPKPDPVPAKDEAAKTQPAVPARGEGARVTASPLARRLAEAQGIDLASVTGSGPNGRIVRADLGTGTAKVAAPAATAPALAAKPAPAPADTDPLTALGTGIPHEVVKLSGMRKIIARRLTESKQTIPHIYLTVDIRLDALLKLRGELNAGLASRNIKLSVNDMLIKALALSLIEVPECNVSFAGDTLIKYSRADISVAVSIPGGLITPIIAGADGMTLSAISRAMGDLAGRAKEGKLQPHEYQGGTASLSNMGMYGIKQFEAVINPPQGMIMAIGAGEARPYVVDGALVVATVMSATGSFDHRAIDGADGARQMKAFKALVENPLGLVA